MNTRPLPFRRLRTILDCILIALLILVAIANYLPVQAKPEPRPPAWWVPVADPITLSNRSPGSGNPALELPLLDDTTSAAMIAAENAALTPPQYLINLSLVTR